MLVGAHLVASQCFVCSSGYIWSFDHPMTVAVNFAWQLASLFASLLRWELWIMVTAILHFNKFLATSNSYDDGAS